MSLWSRIYERIHWKDEPIEETPLSARNLNKMDAALYEIDGRVVELSGYESVVIDYSNQAKTSAQNAKNSEDIAVSSASSAKTDSDLARSYTVGTHGEVRENDDTDNAKYYYEQTKSFVTGSVTGIKGEAEKEFRDGNVIITKGNLGLENVENKSAQEIISEIENATESSDGLMSKEDKVNLDGISNHVSNLSALTQNIIGSDEYNSTKSYTVGEMCIRNNKVYECIVACKGIVPPNITYWKKVSLTSLRNELTVQRGTLIDGVDYAKYGKVVNITFNHYNLSKNNEWVLIGTLPIGFRPRFNTYMPTFNSATTFYGGVVIQPNGDVLVVASSGTDIITNVTYIVD